MGEGAKKHSNNSNDGRSDRRPFDDTRGSYVCMRVRILCKRTCVCDVVCVVSVRALTRANSESGREKDLLIYRLDTCINQTVSPLSQPSSPPPRTPRIAAVTSAAVCRELIKKSYKLNKKIYLYIM